MRAKLQDMYTRPVSHYKSRLKPNVTCELVAGGFFIFMGNPRLRIAMDSQVPRRCRSRSDAFTPRVRFAQVAWVFAV